MKGRKKQPKEVTDIKGTTRPSRQNPDAPQPVDALPCPPSDLTAEERAMFLLLVERMDAIGIASATDTEVITMAARRMQEIVSLSEMIRREGSVVESRRKDGEMMLRAHPAVGQRNEAMRHLQALLAECGLTPAARSKVTAKIEKKANSRFAPRNDTLNDTLN